MKKMMIAVCAIALAGMVQAATVGWTLSGMKSYSGDAYSVFVLGQNGVDTISQITALCGAGKDVSAYAFGSGEISSTGLGSVTAAKSGKTLDAGQTYEAFFVIFDAPTQGEASNYLAITSEQNAKLSVAVSATSATFSFAAGSQESYAGDSKNWSKAGSGVPEPTSGILLVLGCAALALRRKQK